VFRKPCASRYGKTIVGAYRSGSVLEVKSKIAEGNDIISLSGRFAAPFLPVGASVLALFQSLTIERGTSVQREGGWALVDERRGGRRRVLFEDVMVS